MVARRSRVEVEEFGMGFPPKLYGRKFGKTLYTLNLIPLGGFVKLKGEDLADTSIGSFGVTSLWNKTKILLAGVAMNWLVAWALLIYLCMTGLPPVIAGQYSYGAAIDAGSRKVLAVAVATGSPAAQAGISRGDAIVSATIEGRQTTFSTQEGLMNYTKDNAGKSIEIVTEKAGKQTTRSVVLRPPSEPGGYLGVTPFSSQLTRYGPVDSVITASGLVVQLSVATIGAFGNFVVGLFTKAQVSEQVAGPVGIVTILSGSTDLGPAYVILFVAAISLSLAVMNALPLPALDGGRLALIWFSALTRRKINPATEGVIHLGGFVLLIGLMLVVTYFDVSRLFR